LFGAETGSRVQQLLYDSSIVRAAMAHYSSVIQHSCHDYIAELHINAGVMLLRHRIIGETPRAANNTSDSAQAIAKQLMQRALSGSKKSKASKLKLAALARASSEMATASDGQEGIRLQCVYVYSSNMQQCTFVCLCVCHLIFLTL
jgi:hypothetical protein